MGGPQDGLTPYECLLIESGNKNRAIFIYREQRKKANGTEKHRRGSVALVGLLQHSSLMRDITVTI